jgi:hypothetical protein
MPSDPIIVWGPESGRADAVASGSLPIIVWNTRKPLGGMTQEAFEAELRRRLSGRVEAVWIFGSYGTPAFNRDSDVDVILIARTGRTFVERPLDYGDIKGLVPDLDLLVYTPEEFADLTTDPSPGFWTGVVETMRSLL